MPDRITRPVQTGLGHRPWECHSYHKLLVPTLLLLAITLPLSAEDTTPRHEATSAEGPKTIRLPDITVVAEKVRSPEAAIPVSVTAISGIDLSNAATLSIKDAAWSVPNVNLVEFSARFVSQPYIRGVGSSPGNPAVTTYYDGVPQLHGYTSNLGLLEVEQVEFVRGSQGLLYGRNTIGGAINVVSRPPGNAWHGSLSGGYGSASATEANANISGPIGDGTLRFSAAARYEHRDGYTKNDVTGHTLDDREAGLVKSQLYWVPDDRFSVHLIVTNEHDHDGDYALGDLNSIRSRPFHAQRNFEGFANRDVLVPTAIIRYEFDRFDLTSTTGLVDWKTAEATDLDYSAVAAATRENRQKGTQVTQEFRFASPEDRPATISSNMHMKWQIGMLAFSQRYEQIAVNHYGPSVLSVFIPFAVDQTSRARLTDVGLGAYGQATLTIDDVIDIGIGVRGDRETKKAELVTAYSPLIAVDTTVDESRSFTQVSPQLSLACHVNPTSTVYGTINHGYRAGGFNPTSPTGKQAYGEETSASYELGVKASCFDKRISIRAAAFYVAWDDLQLNLPNGQSYYVANAGNARSEGLELELKAQVTEEVSIFSSFGHSDARFRNGATSISTSASGTNSTIDVGGKRLVYAPEVTYHIGLQYTVQLDRSLTVYASPSLSGTGSYYYNAANTESQKSYTLVNVRAGIEGQNWFVEGWANNLFDATYVPIAFEYPNNQSGFLGEVGSPLTIGIRTGIKF